MNRRHVLSLNKGFERADGVQEDHDNRNRGDVARHQAPGTVHRTVADAKLRNRRFAAHHPDREQRNQPSGSIRLTVR